MASEPAPEWSSHGTGGPQTDLCRRTGLEELPYCSIAVWSVPPCNSSSNLRALDAHVSEQTREVLAISPGESCEVALQTFMCTTAFGGCADGQALVPCRSICDGVLESCTWAEQARLHPDLQAKLRCHQYPSDEWPRCAEARPRRPAPCSGSLREHVEDAKVASRHLREQLCQNATAPLVESPCGFCASTSSQGVHFQVLPIDDCGVCNGDNSSCRGCDGLNGAYDACGECNGPAAVCRTLHTDPNLLGYCALGAAMVVVSFFLAPLSMRCLVRTRSPGSARIASRDEPPGACTRSPRDVCVNRCCDYARQGAARVHRFQASCFKSLGFKIAGCPCCVMAVCLCAALCLGCGLLLLRVHLDPLTLWIPADAPSLLNQQRWMSFRMQERVRTFTVILTPRDQTFVDLRAGLLQALSLHGELMALRVPPDAQSHLTVGLLESCEALVVGHCENAGWRHDGMGQCCNGKGLLHSPAGISNLLALWNYSDRLLVADPHPARALLSAFTRAGVDGGISAAWLRSQVSLEWHPTAHADVSVEGDNATIWEDVGGIRAFSFSYVLDGSEGQKDVVGVWEQRAADFLLENTSAADASWSAWQAHVFCEKGLSDDLMDAITSDTLLIACGYTLMGIYTSLFLGRHRDLIRSRCMVSPAAVVSVGLATFAAFGACAAAGVPYTGTVNIAFFVLMGVGVDDAFVIVRALEDVGDEALDDLASAAAVSEHSRRRIGDALGECGTSILLSSTTNAIAFGIGSLSPLPALHSFCIYASVGMVADFLFQVTFFIAVLTLDERRRLLKRWVIMPCVRKPPNFKCCRQHRAGDSAWTLGHGLLAQWLGNPAARCLLLLLYALTLGASIYATFHVEVGLQLPDLVPSGSQTSKFLEHEKAWMPGPLHVLEAFVQHEPIIPGLGVAPLADASVQQELSRLRQALAANAFVSGAGCSVPLWLDAFSEHLRRSGRPPAGSLGEAFREEAGRFLNSSAGAALLEAGLVFRRGDAVVATRMPVAAVNYGAEAMLAVRATLEGSGLGHAAFAYSGSDIYWEQDAVMLDCTATNLLWLVIAVLASVLVLSADVGLTSVMIACVMSCCVHMFGWMVLTRTPLNAVSLIPLLLSVGLCIDFCTHVVHAFWVAPGNSVERAVGALTMRGAAVANGGLSTGLSHLLLLFGMSIVFTTFFKIMAGTVVIGLFHALFVLPVCLSMICSKSGTAGEESDGKNRTRVSPDASSAVTEVRELQTNMQSNQTEEVVHV